MIITTIIVVGYIFDRFGPTNVRGRDSHAYMSTLFAHSETITVCMHIAHISVKKVHQM